MPDTPTVRVRWTKDRWRELHLLRDLIRECRSLDSANRTLERLRFLIKTAEKLDRLDLKARHQSFLQFLQDQALADLKPKGAVTP